MDYMSVTHLLRRYFLVVTLSGIHAQNQYGNGRSTDFDDYGRGEYPMFPQIPWLTVPQRYAGRPLYLPSPLIYASGISNDQVGAYANYRWDYFYAHPDSATTPASGATTSGSASATNVTQSTEVEAQNSGQPAKSCVATNIKNSNGDRGGVCMAETVVGRNCPSGLADDGLGCSSSQKCCVKKAIPKDVQKILDRIAAGEKLAT